MLYIPIQVANVFPSWGTLLPTGALLGIAASILWSAEVIKSPLTPFRAPTLLRPLGTMPLREVSPLLAFGDFQGLNPTAQMGKFNGIFFGFFQVRLELLSRL